MKTEQEMEDRIRGINVDTSETIEEAFDRFIEEMTVLNPKSGFKSYLRMAVNFGANWQKQKYENKI